MGAADDCSVFAVVRVLKIGLRFAARRDNEEALSANFEKLTSGLEGPVYSVGSFVRDFLALRVRVTVGFTLTAA